MAISQWQAAALGAQAYTYDHNYSYYSLLLGEPFVSEGLLYYFDGRVLSLNTFFLRRADPGNARALVMALFEDLQPEAVSIWGPVPDTLVFSVPAGWHRYVIAEPNPHQRDIILSLSTFDPGRVPHLKRSAAHARSEGIEVRISSERQVTWQHLRLIQDWVQDPRVDAFDRLLYSLIPSRLIARPATLVETWSAGSLLGFAVLDFIGEGFPVYLAGFRQRGSAGIGDLLVNELALHCQSAGFRRLSLGHSYTRGLLEFKMKWGECEMMETFWEVLLIRSHSSLRTSLFHWLPRSIERRYEDSI
jgi:hypothetical protein